MGGHLDSEKVNRSRKQIRFFKEQKREELQTKKNGSLSRKAVRRSVLETSPQKLGEGKKTPKGRNNFKEGGVCCLGKGKALRHSGTAGKGLEISSHKVKGLKERKGPRRYPNQREEIENNTILYSKKKLGLKKEFVLGWGEDRRKEWGREKEKEREP